MSSRAAPSDRDAHAAATVEYLPPLSSVEDILWCAALDLVPIEERIVWVEKMTARIEALNERRMRTPRPEAVSVGSGGTTEQWPPPLTETR